MSRRRQATKRQIVPDPKYHSQLVSRLVSTVMISGKKSTAERIVYQAFDALSERQGDRDAYDKKEEGENQIGGCPAVPLSMLQGPIDCCPCAWIIYQHHPGDRHAAKDVERDEAIAALLRHKSIPSADHADLTETKEGTLATTIRDHHHSYLHDFRAA